MQRWINPTNDRYYILDLMQDLFGDWTLIQCWGARGSDLGRVRVCGLASYQEGIKQIAAIEKRRAQRGYRRIDHDGSSV